MSGQKARAAKAPLREACLEACEKRDLSETHSASNPGASVRYEKKAVQKDGPAGKNRILEVDKR